MTILSRNKFYDYCEVCDNSFEKKTILTKHMLRNLKWKHIIAAKVVENKTIDEIAQAASKHREAALSLKTISENQKLKLSKYKARIDELELEVQQYETYASEVACKNIKLENTIKLLTKKLKSKTNDHNSSEEASEEESYLMTKSNSWRKMFKLGLICLRDTGKRQIK